MDYLDAAHDALLELKQGKRTLSVFLAEFARLQRELPPGAMTTDTLRVILIRGVNEPYRSDLIRLNTTHFDTLYDYLQRISNIHSLAIGAPQSAVIKLHLHEARQRRLRPHSRITRNDCPTSTSLPALVGQLPETESDVPAALAASPSSVLTSIRHGFSKDLTLSTRTHSLVGQTRDVSKFGSLKQSSDTKSFVYLSKYK
ncbi:hypothetical protein METBIDRAFT_85053 [Metschnikowia bicuspidata var. bicuspidata NRRL YB-4993]|uniref:Retrotransposon gag domain-containing protein n=1 Tax=Metschnikowia bicuspidata var. bicuspidata NRRL YB-4993 TaxID=869754 RepID=A0A1A0GZ60_9ASCO|nr:hypothetical protein METBIDRAFT_85053 [Metschnikowia bicuspidata var. bicuspidata NRRL YB-4993]OBA17041.1 hypothetical protein METBIDRAFT_85053 [Metschnikowia bicuspidata var. bicuspidata NRRL YB-4993]